MGAAPWGVRRNRLGVALIESDGPHVVRSGGGSGSSAGVRSLSTRGGEAATDLKEVLGGEGLQEQAAAYAAEEGLEDMEELFRSMAKRGRQTNLSFFAFTATPKHKTIAVFGRDGLPVHRYTMRQAIEEGVILDEALIASGMIYSPQYGYAAFTVPLFDALMKRIHG